jgi:hypothetical protein
MLSSDPLSHRMPLALAGGAVEYPGAAAELTAAPAGAAGALCSAPHSVQKREAEGIRAPH